MDGSDHERLFQQRSRGGFGLPVIVVAENRLGCLNHVLLTVRAIETGGLKCVGVVLNNLAREPDLAMTTNAEILRSCLTLPVLAGFDPDKAELGSGLRRMIPEIERITVTVSTEE